MFVYPIRFFLPVAFVAVLGACSSSLGTAENGYPILPPADVTVYQSIDAVPGDYEVLGSVQPYASSTVEYRVMSAAEAERMMARERGNQGRLEWAARRSAGKLGANGLLKVTAADAERDPRIREALDAEPPSVSVPADAEVYVAIYVRPPPVLESGGE